MRISPFTSTDRLGAGLVGLGFAPISPPGRAVGLQRGEMRLRIDRPWVTLELPLVAGDSDDPLGGWMGRPGLWKYVRTPRGAVKRFELPLDAWLGAANSPDPTDEAHEADGDSGGLRAILDWALATADGRVPSGWLSQSAAALPPNELILRHDRFICRGELVNDGRRLALRMPILRRFGGPGPLAQSRAAWLEELLIDAQDRCPMVRFGLDGADAAVQAVVDLTGCPGAPARRRGGSGGELIETMMTTGRDALCWSVRWLVNSVDFLADPDVVSEALAAQPARGSSPSK
jgi:hypothetical protein